MRGREVAKRISACWTAALAMLLAAPAASALADAQLRFVHAVPGAGAVEVTASAGGSETPIGRGIAFGMSSKYARVTAGSVDLTVTEAGEEIVTGSEPLEDDRRYTAVALGGEKPKLAVYEDAEASPRVANVRLIHAAPELDEVDMRVGLQRVGRNIAFGEATGYESVEPGTYELSATRPDEEGDPLVSTAGIPLTAGSASTAFAVGSRGEQTRFVVVADDTVVPAGAPQTGLEPVGDPVGRWALAVAAALAAGTLGGAAYRLSTAGGTGRRHRRDG